MLNRHIKFPLKVSSFFADGNECIYYY